MYTFKQFMMNAQKQKRCPDGYRFDKALNAFKKIIKSGENDQEVFLNLYQIYKNQLRIKDSFFIYKTSINK